MERPWVKPEQVKDYTSSSKVLQRSDTQLAFDIARAEKYVIYYTHNQFKAPEYSNRLPPDVTRAVILLAEAYAKQAIAQKDGMKKSEAFDDYSYTLDTDSNIADSLGLGAMLEDYVLPEDAADVFPEVAAHRIVLNTKARVAKLSAKQVLGEILSTVSRPASFEKKLPLAGAGA